MLSLKDEQILYHGSYCIVDTPDLSKCARRKDFGQGFYITSSKEQAINFLKTSIAKAVAAGDIPAGQKFGYVSKYKVSLKKDLKIKLFENADDQTNATLIAYIGGAYGIVGSKEADQFCISQLLPEKLKDQFCFKTEEALSCLYFMEAEKIWLNK